MTTSQPGGLQLAFRNLQQLVRIGLRAAAIALALFCVMPAAHAQAQGTEESGVRDIRSLNATEKQQLLEKIRKALRHVLDTTHIRSFEGKHTPLQVKFRTGKNNEELVIDLGAENGPSSSSGESDELGFQLESALGQALDSLGISYPDVVYEYGGRDWYYYNPEDLQYQREYERRMQLKGGAAAIPPQGAKVTASAMHGYYWRVFERVWALQRPELSNGIIEDFITPTFVDPLKNYLSARSNTASVDLPRSQSTTNHPVSGYPWWQMDGREYLKVMYPDNPEIWHSLSRPVPDRDPNLWQYDEDIRSRPLFANYIDTDALFNLHTNASTDPSANGTRAFVALGRSYDLALANNVLCGMKELIRAQDAYQGFNVASQAQPSSKYGENNRALMPAMVLEVAFHTNAGDAAALQDPVFVNAAMKGVEKGFRLQAEGKVCKPFKITSIPDVTIQRPGTQIVPVNFEGFPYFPVTMTIENILCPPNNTCGNATIVFSAEQESPLKFQFSCTGSSSSTDTSRWSTRLADADGVKTTAVEHALTCLPSSGVMANSKPSIRIDRAN